MSTQRSPRRKVWDLLRWLVVLVATGFVAAVILYAVGALPRRETPPEIRFYLEGGVSAGREEVERASALVEETKRSLERYRDPDAARDDGYFNAEGEAGGAVMHWLNLQYMRDGRILDPARPENLMYYRTTAGRDVLVGAMFVMQGPGETGPPVGGEMTRWHLHTAYCWAPAGFPIWPSGSGSDPCPPGHAQMDTPEMLHVWVVPNPGGVFATEMDLEAPPESP